MTSQVSPSKRSLNGQKKLFHYLNATGPGDYDTVSLTGGALLESGKRNAPNFTFGTKSGKAPIITK